MRQTLRFVVCQAFLVALVFGFGFFFLDYTFLAQMMVLCALIYCYCFWALGQQLSFAPRFLCYLTVNFSVFVISASLGFDCYVWTFFFPAALAPALFFTVERQLRRMLMIGTPAIFLIALLLQLKMGSGPLLPIPQYDTGHSFVIGSFSILTSLTILVSLIVVFSAKQLRSQRFLESQRARLTQQEKMISLGTLAAGVAHEINNSLTTLRLNLDIVERKIQPMMDSDEKLKTSSERIQKNVGRIINAVSGLRAFAQDHSAMAARVPIRHAFRQVQTILQPKLNSENVKIDFFMTEADSAVDCNQSQLIQILMNMVLNSIEALKKSDHRWIRVEVAAAQDFVEIKLVDSGIGIAKEIQPRLFEPFFTTKPPGYGMGLGLAVAQSLAISNGGKIYYDSDKPNTTFVIHLRHPLAEERLQHDSVI